MRHFTTAALASAFCVATATSALAGGQAKNVILMIADGQGFNTVKATDYYAGTPAVYESFAVKGAVQTNSANNPAGYNPATMWTNFTNQKSGATDSSSAATAMYTGVKIYDSQMNVTTTGQNLTTFFENAAAQGKATGAVSTVNFDHATPATTVANTPTRDDYTSITSQMLNSNLDVIMGAGNPWYNNDGVKQSTASYGIVGTQANWTAITGETNGRKFIESKADFEALANGTLTASKVFGVAQAKDTLQERRSGTPLNSNVPTLSTMVQGTLNVLDNNPNGFAVMFEGGAVDWANHDNKLDRMIQEERDFNAAVQTVVDYLNANTNGNNWNNTLLIVTADHETGCLWGPTTGTFNQIVNNGVGVLPGAAYNSGSHTNTLVPFFAQGADASLFNAYLTGTDTEMDNRYGIDAAFNHYIDNTDIFKVMTASVAVPEPATLSLLAIGALGLLSRRNPSGRSERQ